MKKNNMKKYNMKRHTCYLFLSAFIIPSYSVFAGESAFYAGTGVNYAPAYEGSDKYQFSPMLDASASYSTDSFGVFSLGTDGLIWALPMSENLTFSSIVSYDGGRDEKIGVFGSKNEELKGMGDLDGSLLVGGALNYKISDYDLYIKSMVATKNRHYGGRDVGHTAYVELGGIATYQLNEKWSMNYNLASTWTNNAYNQAYFGVSEQQATRSKFSTYEGGSGFKDVNGAVIVNYNLNKNFALHTGVGAYYLLGKSADSPISEKRLGLIGLAGVSYSF